MYGVKAQDISIDTSGVDINGDTLLIPVTETNASDNYAYELDVSIHNNSTKYKIVNVIRTNAESEGFAFPIGHQMCAGENCYTTDTINGLRIEAGESIDLSIHIEFSPEGYSYDSYEIFVNGDEANKLTFVAHYYSPQYIGVGTLENTNYTVNVYPNPARSIINFDYNLSNNSYITIHDVTGKQIKKINLQDNFGKETMDISSFNNGIYFYNVFVDNQKISTNKFIVRH